MGASLHPPFSCSSSMVSVLDHKIHFVHKIQNSTHTHTHFLVINTRSKRTISLEFDILLNRIPRRNHERIRNEKWRGERGHQEEEAISGGIHGKQLSYHPTVDFGDRYGRGEVPLLELKQGKREDGHDQNAPRSVQKQGGDH